jgi:Tfp pilus assembly protein PilO
MNLKTLAATRTLGCLGLLVIIALGWLLIVGPKTAALADVRLQISTTRDQNDTLQLQLVALEKQAEQLDEVRATARALAVKFPPTADQPGLFREVTAAAQDAGIGPDGLTSLAPTPPVEGGGDVASGIQLEDPSEGLAKQTMAIAVTGSYDQMQQFLENLELMPRSFLITSVALSGGGETGEFTTTISGDMFVMAPAIDPEETQPEAEETQPEAAE